MVVYPKEGKAYIYAWAAKEFKQKAAKVFAGSALTVLKEESGWYEVAKLPEGSYGAYPQVAAKWFVDPLDVEQHTAVPAPDPVPAPIPTPAADAAAGAAFTTLFRWVVAVIQGRA